MGEQAASTIDVIFAANHAYVPHAAAALHSLLTYTPGARPHLMHGADLTPEDAAGLRSVCGSFGADLDLRRVSVEDLDGVPELIGGRLPLHAWFRVLIPRVFEDLDRALYLDADLIVLDSLLHLATVDLEGHLLAAVRDISDPGNHERPEVGLSAERPYLNSGVLVLDLAAIRREGFVDHVLATARRYGEALAFADQDAINVVLGGDWQQLAPRWNLQTMGYRRPVVATNLFGEEAAREALTRPATVHFTGFTVASKPWHLLSRHSYRNTYWAHRQATPWRRRVPEGISARTVFRWGRGMLARAAGRRDPEPPAGPLPKVYRRQVWGPFLRNAPAWPGTR